MMNRSSIIVASALLLSGCSNQDGGPLPAFFDPDVDLYEAVIRDHLPQAERSPGEGQVVVYVAHRSGPASPMLIDRFRNEPIPVKPASEYRPDEPGVRAFMVLLGDVHRDRPDRPRVMVNAHPAAEPQDCGTPYPVPLRRDGDRWVVAAK